MSAPTSPRPPRDPHAVLGSLGLPMIGLLAIELLLGMALNLFTTLPSGSATAILASSPVLIVHLLVGLALVGITARALGLSIRLGEGSAMGASALGLVSVLVAFLAGLSFTFGNPSPGASYLMTAGFTGALLSAGMLLWVSRSAGPAVSLDRPAVPPAPQGRGPA